MIDDDTLPNPGPIEAEQMDEAELQTILFRRNYGMRHDRDPYWRRLHLNFAKQALRSLRYLTQRQRKVKCVKCGCVSWLRDGLCRWCR